MNTKVTKAFIESIDKLPNLEEMYNHSNKIYIFKKNYLCTNNIVFLFFLIDISMIVNLMMILISMSLTNLKLCNIFNVLI